METVNNILNQQIEKELDLNSKLEEKCQICGKHMYKQYELFGKNKIVRVMCDCEAKKLEEEKSRQEAQEKQLRLERLITNSLMDKSFRKKTFENWDFSKGAKQMYELGLRYTKNFKKCKEEGIGLLIYGEPGNGKTYLSSAIANELLKQFVPVICVSINGLLSRIQETYSRWGKEAEADVIRGLCNADLLIIDDLGAERKVGNSDWTKTMIYNIIDSRYRSNLPLIITSNLKINLKQTNGVLTELYERRTEDRILEMCTPVHNTAKSIRVDEAKKKTKLLKDILYGVKED
ncbi:ATP-binding protein [Clostridium thermopalmarium]|uniref:DNA replication protein DnaC n=1 Tax=Clostridium thermopalmarium DSM 5974 TaxID=1121340 RepID=A0A2T0APE7_9CLOT|nr:ATP-binding protein [Clostridium thermopalmarium]PRR70889.1 DNA replication protein DnaC [Clostridium thermopalmarium DSM 5974]PVZ28813.1 phage DNA replication protein (predicted replicative helicase loader) [Clostridium thermopalmarium DSM 5974]